MLLLTSTSDKIQVVTGSAGDIDIHASYADYDGTAVTVGRKNTNPTTATTTDVVDPPASLTSRNVKALHIANVHASTSNQVTIIHTDGTTAVQLESVNLLAGERISYREGVGMRVIDASGLEKVNSPISVGQYLTARLGATVTNSTVTAAKITGLDQVCGVGTWIFEYFLRVQSATVTVSPKFSVNHSGTVTSFMATLSALTTDATGSAFAWDQDVVAPTVMSGMAQRAKSAAATMVHSVTTNAVDTINSDILVQITGLMVVTVSGNLELWHASETATATSIMQDSALRLTKVG